MTKKNLVQVVIGGKVLTMGGSDDELHIQKVAACVNRKLAELEPTESYRALPLDLKPVLVELNLADDLIQAQETIEMLKSDLRTMENELSEVKQKLVETQLELEELESSAVQMTFSDVGWMPGQKGEGHGEPLPDQDSEAADTGMAHSDNENPACKQINAGNADGESAEEVTGKTMENAAESSEGKSVRKSYSANRRKSRKR